MTWKLQYNALMQHYLADGSVCNSSACVLHITHAGNCNICKPKVYTTSMQVPLQRSFYLVYTREQWRNYRGARAPPILVKCPPQVPPPYGNCDIGKHITNNYQCPPTNRVPPPRVRVVQKNEIQAMGRGAP